MDGLGRGGRCPVSGAGTLPSASASQAPGGDGRGRPVRGCGPVTGREEPGGAGVPVHGLPYVVLAGRPRWGPRTGQPSPAPGLWTTTGAARTVTRMPTWTIDEEPVSGTGVDEMMAQYFSEMGLRVRGRPVTEGELRRVIDDDPHSGLGPPHGTFLVARDSGGEILGYAGVRMLAGVPATAELKRMYVRPAGRDWGGACSGLSRRRRGGWVLPASCARPIPNSPRRGPCTRRTATGRPDPTTITARRSTGTSSRSAKGRQHSDNAEGPLPRLRDAVGHQHPDCGVAALSVICEQATPWLWPTRPRGRSTARTRAGAGAAGSGRSRACA